VIGWLLALINPLQLQIESGQTTEPSINESDWSAMDM